MNSIKTLLSLLLVISLSACNQQVQETAQKVNTCKGKLFIIGGGKRPASLVERMISEAGVDTSGYILVLPMASAEEDSAIYYSSKQFTDVREIRVLSATSSMIRSDPDMLSSLISKAALIYISGGDQVRFMNSIEGTAVRESIFEAYCNGAMIAGTSAGAAVMSSKMITGNEFKHPVYTGQFPTIEANNIELKEGLGLLGTAIIDQHFIKRQRLNRLIAVSLENPENTCIGIDESTALLVKPGYVEVVGESQVILLRHPMAETKIVNGLLGGKDLELSVYLPGDTIDFE